MTTPSPIEVLHASSSTGDASVTLGAGTAVGDILLIIGGTDYRDIASWTDPTGPFASAGSPLAEADLGVNDSHMRAWLVEVNAAGANTVTVPRITDSDVAAWVYRFAAGVQLDNGAAAGATVTSAATSHAAPSVAPATADALLISAALTGGAASTTWTKPASMTSQGSESPFTTMSVADETLSSSGATGTRTWTSAGSRTSVLLSIALKGAGGTDATVNASTIAATAALPAPAPSAGSTVAPAVVAAAASLPAGAVQTGATVSPGVVVAVAALPAVTVEAGGNATVTPATIATTAAVPAPAPSAGSTVSPATIAAVAALPAAHASTGTVVVYTRLGGALVSTTLRGAVRLDGSSIAFG